MCNASSAEKICVIVDLNGSVQHKIHVSIDSTPEDIYFALFGSTMDPSVVKVLYEGNELDPSSNISSQGVCEGSQITYRGILPKINISRFEDDLTKGSNYATSFNIYEPTTNTIHANSYITRKPKHNKVIRNTRVLSRYSQVFDSNKSSEHSDLTSGFNSSDSEDTQVGVNNVIDGLERMKINDFSFQKLEMERNQRKLFTQILQNSARSDVVYDDLAYNEDEESSGSTSTSGPMPDLWEGNRDDSFYVEVAKKADEGFAPFAENTDDAPDQTDDDNWNW